MTKDQFNSLLNDVQHLAMDIGVRPAARALGLSEARVMKWSSRYKWGIAALFPPGLHVPRPSAMVSGAIEAKRRILEQHRSRTQLGMAQSATNAFEHLADKPGNALCSPATAIAASQWAKVADITHGYAAERTAPPQVQVAIISQPTEIEREERRAMHARLDDIARRLADGARDS
jgi:hypothetical protein